MLRRTAIYEALALYFDARNRFALWALNFADIAAQVVRRSWRRCSIYIAAAAQSDRNRCAWSMTLLAEAMAAMPQALRRRVLLAYLGFPFYDTVTLPLLRGEGLTEFDPDQGRPHLARRLQRNPRGAAR